MENNGVNIKLISETATVPTKGSKEAAGLDLYADLSGNNIMIQPHRSFMIPLGFQTEMPQGWVGLVFSRSGISLKKGLRLANSVGVIDSDYRGEWKLLVYNDSDCTQIIEHGERIAQVVFTGYMDVQLNVVEELNDTERGDGGFGSTGTK